MAVARYLIDKSVLARQGQRAVADKIQSLSDRGLLALCGATEIELMYSARNVSEGDSILSWINDFERLPITDTIWGRALEVQRLLLAKAQHRGVQLPDLIIASTAERHGVTVLHHDRDFDRIAKVTGQSTEWVVPPGEADLSDRVVDHVPAGLEIRSG